MTGLSSSPTSDGQAPTLTGMTTQYAARRVVLGENDSEPTGLASEWGDGPAPRRALDVAEEIPTTFDSYVPAPELLPFNVVQRMDPVAPQPRFAPELGLPMVAPPPSQTPGWHIAVEPSTPLAPGPVHAATPVTVGPLTDPASFPTPVSNLAAVSYRSMPSPMPYASAPGQGPYVAPMASPAPYGAMPQPYAVSTPVSDEVEAAGVKVVAAASIFQKVFGLVIVGISLAAFTAMGTMVGGKAWWTVGFAWGVGLIMLVGILMPGRMRLRRSALK